MIVQTISHVLINQTAILQKQMSIEFIKQIKGSPWHLACKAKVPALKGMARWQMQSKKRPETPFLQMLSSKYLLLKNKLLGKLISFKNFTTFFSTAQLGSTGKKKGKVTISHFLVFGIMWFYSPNHTFLVTKPQG